MGNISLKEKKMKFISSHLRHLSMINNELSGLCYNVFTDCFKAKMNYGLRFISSETTSNFTHLEIKFQEKTFFVFQCYMCETRNNFY